MWSLFTIKNSIIVGFSPLLTMLFTLLAGTTSSDLRQGYPDFNAKRKSGRHCRQPLY